MQVIDCPSTAVESRYKVGESVLVATVITAKTGTIGQESIGVSFPTLKDKESGAVVVDVLFKSLVVSECSRVSAFGCNEFFKEGYLLKAQDGTTWHNQYPYVRSTLFGVGADHLFTLSNKDRAAKGKVKNYPVVAVDVSALIKSLTFAESMVVNTDLLSDEFFLCLEEMAYKQEHLSLLHTKFNAFFEGKL